MDVIDADWIKDRLTGKRGEQSRLAEAMGIDNDKMSRVMRGKRRVQPEEIPKVLEFFSENLSDEQSEARLRASKKMKGLSEAKIPDLLKYIEYLESLPDEEVSPDS